MYGLLAEAVAHPPDFSSVIYRLRAQARWHDGKPVTPEDVIFSFEAVEEIQPAVRRLLPPRRQGGEDRRSRGHLHVRRSRQSRIAADRRPAYGAAQALVGRNRRCRQEARRRRDHARAAARQRPLPDQGVRGRPQHRVRAGKGLLGPGPQRQRSGRIISTRCATSISAIRRSRSKPSRRDQARLAHREQSPRTGPPPTISRRSGTSAWCWRSSRSPISASCRRSSSIPGATNSRMPGCAGRSISPSISRR